MNGQLRNRIWISLVLTASILALLVTSGCGNSTKSTVPEKPANPFEMALVGTDSTLEVMTWNLEHFAKSTTTTTDHVIKVIEALEVDVIGLQEIENASYFQAVIDGLDGWTGFKASSAGYSLNLAFIYREDVNFQVESIQEIMTSENREFPRRPLMLLGSFDGMPIAVINNHLKCCGDGYIDEDEAWDEETRRRDACLLLEDYALTNLTGRRVYFIGDFNDELTDNMDHNVFANFLGDPAQWRAADMVVAEGPSSGWSFLGWPSHLDHIIINAPLFSAVDGSDTEIYVVPLHSFLPLGYRQYDDDISDHLPVVLKLKI